MKVINIWSGPGSGKSTTAAGLFYHMKALGLECELIQEYAKDMVWENRHNILEDQIYVFAKQQRRIARLKDHNLDWVITDSPIPLGLCYMKPSAWSESFNQLVMQVFHNYENHNFYLKRSVEYNPNGRNQKHVQEAIQFDSQILNLLETANIPYVTITGAQTAVADIMTHLGMSGYTHKYQ